MEEYKEEFLRATDSKHVRRPWPFEEEHEIRSKFQRDRDRILYSKAFRRLKGKTQIFPTDSEDHLRTRLIHTLEVSQIAATISNMLGLNITKINLGFLSRESMHPHKYFLSLFYLGKVIFYGRVSCSHSFFLYLFMYPYPR